MAPLIDAETRRSDHFGTNANTRSIIRLPKSGIRVAAQGRAFGLAPAGSRGDAQTNAAATGEEAAMIATQYESAGDLSQALNGSCGRRTGMGRAISGPHAGAGNRPHALPTGARR